MVVDIVCAGVVLLLGLFGYFSGFLRQIGKLIGLVLGFLAARALADSVGETMATAFGLGLFVAKAIAFALIFFLVTMLFRFVWGILTGGGRVGESPTRVLDRGLGGLLGAAKGALLVYVAMALLLYAGPELEARGTKLPFDLSGSLIAREVQKRNLIADEIFPRAQAIEKVAAILQKPERLQVREDDPDVAFLLSHDKAQFLSDPDIAQALREGRWDFVVADGRVFALLADREIVAALNRLELNAEAAAP